MAAVEIRQDADTGLVSYRSLSAVPVTSKALQEYFHLGPSLRNLCKQWGKGHHILQNVFRGTYKGASQLCGLRLLCQTPEDCLLSFICSQNNHLTRIQAMVLKLCTAYGTKVADPDYYTFPSAEAIVKKATESQLRELGFGYRASYILSAAQWLQEHRIADLHRSKVDLASARMALMQIKGVGRKVADCVMLFSLGHHDVVPVDTHIQQIAEAYLGLEGTLTEARHTEVQRQFLEAYGSTCGWAHCVLFYARILGKDKDSVVRVKKEKKRIVRGKEDSVEQKRKRVKHTK